jgi:hypothetical protein
MATNKTGNRIQSVIQNSLMISHDKAAQISQRICLSNHQSASNGRSYCAKACLSWKFLHALLDRAACKIVSSKRRWARFHRAGRHHLAVSRGLLDPFLLHDIAFTHCHEPNLRIRRRRFGAAFRPFVIIITVQQRPELLFVAAIIGVGSLLRVGGDMTTNPRTFVKQCK